jgi:hypothetical protein
MFRRCRTLAGLAALAVAGAGLVAGSPGAAAQARCPLPVFGPGPAYHPTIEPEDFSATVDNPLFPLVVGRTLVYSGVKDGKKALNLFTTTARTKRIDGVSTRVVEDRLYLDNVLEERTSDYYSQDRCGNVWYFGEDTAQLDERGAVVSIDGSFRAGVDGAQPGVFMQASPRMGRVFRQEWSRGHAEDRFWALSRSASITVPLGSFHGALRTAEATDLEPVVRDNKYYLRGIGEVAELSVRGSVEELRLVEIIS